MQLSVVVPVLDEAARIGATVRDLVGRPELDEVIVVDGGSADATVDLAASAGARVLAAPRGRAPQMNAGAAEARGEVLLFVHADARLPEGAGAAIRAALADPDVVGGAFRIRTVGERGSWVRPLLPLADLRSRYTRLPYGDQALFVRAAAFRRVGGYADLALMEDLDLSRRLWREGRLRVLPQVVEVSGRRFLDRPVRAFVTMNVFPTLFRLGVPTPWLARIYGDPR